MHPATSTYLDLLRLTAAVVVFFGHAGSLVLTGGLPVLWRFVSFGNDAVMAFFVLSGFVIAHVARERERTPTVYAVSRLARLYSVVAPAIALTVVADTLGSSLAPSLYGADWFATDGAAWRIAANLFFVNELWFSSTRPFSNVPFWSLGYEFWYYMIFGAAIFLRGRVRVVVIGGLALIVGPKILLLLPVWLAGVWAYRRTQMQTLSVRAGALLAVGSLLGYLFFRLLDGPGWFDGVTKQWLGSEGVAALHFSKWFLSSYVIGMFMALHLVGVAALAPLLARRLPGPVIRYLASFTFALYLFHYPLLYFFAAWLEHAGLSAWRGALVIPATLLTVWLLGQLTERRKPTVRRWLSAAAEVMAKEGRRWAVAAGVMRH